MRNVPCFLLLYDVFWRNRKTLLEYIGNREWGTRRIKLICEPEDIQARLEPTCPGWSKRLLNAKIEQQSDQLKSPSLTSTAPEGDIRILE
jgi:hypothetical protein